MSDRADTLVLSTFATRREFTLEAALAIPAGCVITVFRFRLRQQHCQPRPQPRLWT